MPQEISRRTIKLALTGALGLGGLYSINTPQSPSASLLLTQNDKAGQLNAITAVAANAGFITCRKTGNEAAAHIIKHNPSLSADSIAAQADIYRKLNLQMKSLHADCHFIPQPQRQSFTDFLLHPFTPSP